MRDLTALVISLSVLLVLSVLWMHACGICAQPQPRGTVHQQKGAEHIIRGAYQEHAGTLLN